MKLDDLRNSVIEKAPHKTLNLEIRFMNRYNTKRHFKLRSRFIFI